MSGSDGAGLDPGVSQEYPAALPLPDPEGQLDRHGCRGRHDFKDNFGVFELPTLRGSDLDPTSIGPNLQNLG